MTLPLVEGFKVSQYDVDVRTSTGARAVDASAGSGDTGHSDLFVFTGRGIDQYAALI